MEKLPGVDVVIVGAGMGGAAFAWSLSQRLPGCSILCLERGRRLPAASIPTTHEHWQRAALGIWSTSPNTRLASGGNRLSNDYPIDDSGTPLKPLMWNGVGGSTVNWAAHFPRLHPSDFRTRTLDGVGDDWPFGYAELEPYYDLNDEMTGVCGLAGDPACPAKPPRQPPLPIGRMGRKAAEAFNALGWHWWPVDAAILTEPRPGREACNGCGPCLLGCTRRAKASTDVTYWPAALGNGVVLRTGTVVTAVAIAGGRATGVIVRGENGREQFQPAGRVVVAGNGIGTVRLLKASGLGDGAESSLGRNLMMHPVGYARGMLAERLDGPAGPVGTCLYSHQFYETDRGRGFVRGLQLQVTRENALLLQALRLTPAWGAEAQRQLAEEFSHALVVMVMTEDLPEPGNRVRVGSDLEMDGLPSVSITYEASANTEAMLRWGLDRAAEVLEAAGARRIVRAPYPPMTGWHQLGTARMGEVVDASGRVHGVPNLIIADGSVMPTAGAVNPASTIGALALKFAHDLARELGAA